MEPVFEVSPNTQLKVSLCWINDVLRDRNSENVSAENIVFSSEKTSFASSRRLGDSRPPLTGFVCTLSNSNLASFMCFTASNNDANKGGTISVVLSKSQRSSGATRSAADTHQLISSELLSDGAAFSATDDCQRFSTGTKFPHS